MLVDLQGYLLHSKSVVKSPSQGRIQSYHASLPINHKTKRVLKSLSIQDVNESPGDKTSKDSDLPTRKELFLFAVPTLAIWLLQPILSLIDTAVLGMSKSTSIYEVAALGPGISWIDSSSYLFYFLGIVTTNLFAAALRDNDPKERHNVLVNTLQLALLFGFVLFALQFFGASFMVRQLSGASIQSVPFGTDYAKIRAVAAPFALLSFVAQSAFLASKDAMTPLHAVLIGSLVNLFGDLLLVQGFHYGIRGAAVATALSQVCSTVYLWYRAVKSASKPVSASITGRIFQAPHWTEMRRVLSLCGPLCAVLFIKTCHWSLSTFAASSAGVYSLAAHQVTRSRCLALTSGLIFEAFFSCQVVINCFFFFCIFGDVVGQVVQSYATYTLPTPSNHDISESSNSSIDGSISHNTGTLSVEENGTKNRNDVSQRLVGQLTTQGAQLVEAMSQVSAFVSTNSLLCLTLTVHCCLQ